MTKESLRIVLLIGVVAVLFSSIPTFLGYQRLSDKLDKLSPQVRLTRVASPSATMASSSAQVSSASAKRR